MQRLESRNISLSEEQSERLENGVKKAGDKGINESLVMIDSLAFIVNVPNKTVVTAMDQTETQSNVFTNIDGAVIV
jgi:flagellar operon protein